MNTIEIPLKNIKDRSGFIKMLSFVSESIIGYNVDENEIQIHIDKKENIKEVERKLNKILGKFLKNANIVKDKVIWTNYRDKRTYHAHEEIYKSNLIQKVGDGLISLNGNAIFLFQYFDMKFAEIARNLGAEEKFYPTLLPLDESRKTGYFTTSPQYLMFCSSVKEDIEVMEHLRNVENNDLPNYINQPNYTLSPAACFHTYVEYKNQTVKKAFVTTFNQNVFRFEGRFNWNDFARLCDYHVREIVFFGEQKDVLKLREDVLHASIEFLKAMDIDAQISSTCDPFIVPSMQKYKKYQLNQEVKYELQLNHTEEDTIAVASYNLHGKAFTEPFHIQVESCDNPVTGCVGFGIERWVLAFLSQYGCDVKDWPDEIQFFIKERKKLL